MKARMEHCSDVELDTLVRGTETSELFRNAASHIEVCQACQRKLTQRVGKQGEWSELRDMLRPVDGDCGDSGELLRLRKDGNASLQRVASDDASVRGLLETPSHPEMLGRLGRYEIERVIGSGGMGVVLKGFDSELNRPVAVKMLAPHLARVGSARQRFAREARSAAAVVHEHVVSIHDVESDADVPYLVMQYVPGESLQVRVERGGPLDVNEILRIGSQVAGGLAAAHQQGIVHRDIKPSNILLEGGVERAYLTDFGLARVVDDASLTQTGIVAGTPQYMAPEQANGGVSDVRSDLFSLGSVLYFMATGHPPFRAERAMAVLHRICHDSQRPLWMANRDIPDEVSVLVDHLLEKRPARRPASADTVRLQLVGLLGRVRKHPSRIVRRIRRLAMTHRTRILPIAVCVVGSLGAVGWYAMHGNTKPDAEPTSPIALREGLVESELPMPVLSSEESNGFAREVEGIRSRLERLDGASRFASSYSDADNWSEQLQLIHRRLDRLQEASWTESHPISIGEEQ
jgi:serine/threonine protein kinase